LRRDAAAHRRHDEARHQNDVHELRLAFLPTGRRAGWGASVTTQVYPTSPVKRQRRTRAQLEQLDKELYLIAAKYQPLTVRAVFYQAEVRGLVPKTEEGYDVVQRRLLILRRAKRIPYPWITDGVRYVQGEERYAGPDAFLQDVASLYRRDYWRSNLAAVEVWIEKDALAGSIAPVVVSQWGLDLWISRGLSSESYLYRAGRAIAERRKPTHVLVLTDFDPSGLLIEEKIADGLPGFTEGVEVHVERLAVTSNQVAWWNLPTRPVKRGDSRAARFMKTFGDRCAELDAIEPTMLRKLVDENIARFADRAQIERLKVIEAEERENIARVTGGGRP
jgi:hypothetical protein